MRVSPSQWTTINPTVSETSTFLQEVHPHSSNLDYNCCWWFYLHLLHFVYSIVLLISCQICHSFCYVVIPLLCFCPLVVHPSSASSKIFYPMFPLDCRMFWPFLYRERPLRCPLHSQLLFWYLLTCHPHPRPLLRGRMVSKSLYLHCIQQQD